MTDRCRPTEDPFDPEQFLERLRRAGLEQEQVAARRPPAAAISTVLRQTADLVYAVFELERNRAAEAKGLDPRSTYTWLATGGSLADGDRIWVDAVLTGFVESRDLVSLEFADTNPSRNSIDWGIGLLAHAMNTVVDHLHGIADSVESGRTIRSPLTMSRTVLEAAATACHIADLEVDERERLRRVHNLRMDEAKEGANHRVGDGDTDYLLALEELVAFAQAAGFTVRTATGHRPPGIAAPRGHSDAIRDLIEAVLPGVGRSTYRSLSAVAHCRPSVGDVLPDEYSLRHEIKDWRTTEKIAQYAIPALIATHEMVRRVAAYLHWDDHSVGDSILTVLSLLGAGAGWKDDQIRQELGFDPVE